MPKTNEYLGRESKNGVFSCHIKAEINLMLDLYCKVNGKNKTAYVNEILQKDMLEKFDRLLDVK